jgi:hypothetical protein
MDRVVIPGSCRVSRRRGDVALAGFGLIYVVTMSLKIIMSTADVDIWVSLG